MTRYFLVPHLSCQFHFVFNLQIDEHLFYCRNIESMADYGQATIHPVGYFGKSPKQCFLIFYRLE